MADTDAPSKDELYDLYWRHHCTIGEIADQYDVANPTIRALLTEYGIPCRADGSVSTYVSRMLSKDWYYDQYWRAGKSFREIAEEYDLHKLSLNNAMQAKGIPIRRNGRPSYEPGTVPRGFGVDAERLNERDDRADEDELLPENPDPSKYLANTNGYDKDWLYEMYWGYGLTLKEVAARADVSADVLRYRLQVMGIPIRNHGTDANNDWSPHKGVPPMFEYEEVSEQEQADRDQYAKDKKGSPWRMPTTGD